MYAMSLPLGDQLGSSPLEDMTCLWCPFARMRTMPSRPAKTIDLPLGDQSGETFDLNAVRRFRCVPFGAIVKIAYLLCEFPTTYAMRLPFGDHAGSSENFVCGILWRCVPFGRIVQRWLGALFVSEKTSR